MPLERRCIFHGRLIDLTAVEVRLLQFFVDHPDRVLSRAELMQAVWNGQPIEARNVAMHVNNLREKLAAAGGAIATVRKLGYRFDATPACHPSGTP
jgi:DNA-binding response OmpR family regulator